MFDKITNACQYLLENYPEAEICRNYLGSRLDSESQKKFQFGYFPNVQNIQALISLVGEELLKECGLLYSRNIEDSLCPRQINFSFFEDHPLVLPFKDTYGNVVALVGRTLLDDKDRKVFKYKNTEFTKGNYVFGLFENKRDIIQQNCVYVVEGQFDVIKSVEKGFKNIVALGSSNMTSYQLSVISRYTNNIFLLLDNDEAGQKGRKRIIDKFGALANIRNFYLPDNVKDIDEYLHHNSYDDLSFIVKD